MRRQEETRTLPGASLWLKSIGAFGRYLLEGRQLVRNPHDKAAFHCTLAASPKTRESAALCRRIISLKAGSGTSETRGLVSTCSQSCRQERAQETKYWVEARSLPGRVRCPIPTSAVSQVYAFLTLRAMNGHVAKALKCPEFSRLDVY